MKSLPTRLRRGAVLASLVCSVLGCAVVKINHDATDSVEHAGGDKEGVELANRACHTAGAVRAEVISTVKKDDSAPPGEGRSVTSFRCIY